MGLYYIYGTSNSNDNDNKDNNDNDIHSDYTYMYNVYIIKRLKGSVICINKYVYNINNMFQPVQFYARLCNL